MACDQGTDSPGNDATSCSPCQPGYFTSGAGKPCVASPPGQFVPVGALSPRPCTPGSYSDGGAAGCSLCPAGKFSNLDGSNSAGCGFCPISYYSASPGSSLCSACSGGKVTPKPGSTSESACLSPINNFVLGSFALGMAGFGALYYVVMGGFHFTAFIRRERVVKPQVKVYRDFVKEIIKEKKEAIDKNTKARKEKEKARTDPLERQESNKNECCAWENWGKRIMEFAKALLFVPFAICAAVVATLAVFAILIAQVFFKSLIIYKQSHTFLPLLEYRQVIFQLIDDINAYLAGVPGAFVLRFFFSFMRWLFDILASFKIDFSAVGVTCEGATAPFQLLVNLFVFGVVVIVVESELQSFRGLCFQRTLERYGAHLLSREYRRRKITGLRNGIFKFLASLCWYTLGLFGLLTVQLVFFVINFQNLLQFLLSLVVFSSFTSSSNGTHAYSDTCNQVDGAENFDTALSFGSTGIAYLLILPVFYEISKILCPVKMSDPEPNIEPTETASPMQPMQNYQVTDCEVIKPESIESVKPTSSDEQTSIWRVLNTLELSTWLRLPMTLISPDLILAHLTSGFVQLLRGSNTDEENKTAMQRSLSDMADNESTLLRQIGNSVVKFVKSVVITLRPLQDSPEDQKWKKEKRASVMPSYLELVQLEIHELSGKSEYFAPPCERTDGDYPMIGKLFTALLLLVPIGHFSVVGRCAFKLALKNYVMFLQVSLGIWSPEAARAYNVVGKTNEFSDDKSKLTKQNVLASITAIVATRAILLQLIPQLAILSVFTIATAGSPQYVDPSLGDKISKWIVTDCYKEAKAQEEEETTSTEHPFWIIMLSAISIFVLDSRAFAFIARSYMVFLSIYILYAPPTNTIIAVTVLVLMPVALASALRFVVVLGRAMHVKDLWWACCHEEDDTNQEQVDTGAAGSGHVEMAAQSRKTIISNPMFHAHHESEDEIPDESGMRPSLGDGVRFWPDSDAGPELPARPSLTSQFHNGGSKSNLLAPSSHPHQQPRRLLPPNAVAYPYPSQPQHPVGSPLQSIARTPNAAPGGNRGALFGVVSAAVAANAGSGSDADPPAPTSSHY